MGTKVFHRSIALLAAVVFVSGACVVAAQRAPVTEAVDPEMETLHSHNLDVGRQYFKKKAWAGARGRFEEIAGAYPEFTKIAEVYYLLGVCYVKTDNAKAARKVFRKLIDERPDSEFAARAKEELEKLPESPDT